VVYERWQNLAALQAHLETDYIKTLLKAVGEVLEGGPELRILIPAER
jgi:quinol monooxygenase YgiN